MALTSEWDRVGMRLRELERIEGFSAIAAAMLRLVDRMREDPRFRGVDPAVSMVSLNLRLKRSKRSIMVACAESGDIKVSFVDPPLEFSETRHVGENDALDTIVEFVNRIKERVP